MIWDFIKVAVGVIFGVALLVDIVRGVVGWIRGLGRRS
jgi:hypothetical protein